MAKVIRYNILAGQESPCKQRKDGLIMKRNTKFFTAAVSLLLLSSVILTGCMYAISRNKGEQKPYDPDGQKENPGDAGNNIIWEAPPAQDSLQATFEAMYEISEDGHTITVISEDYLNRYWYSSEKVHSLTAEEVFYIIQDSIRIYETYDKVVLTGFDGSDAAQAADRFPAVEDAVIETSLHKSLFFNWDDKDAIYRIIRYRLQALSSPEAFFLAPILNFGSSELPEYYIPGYSENTDRDYILESFRMSDSDIDPDRTSDLFCVGEKHDVISFVSKADSQRTKVYPTAELENKMLDPGFSFRIPALGNALLEYTEDCRILLDGVELTHVSGPSMEDLSLYDITGDGTPELCFVMSFGSGIITKRIVIVDYETKEPIFVSLNRQFIDYALFIRREKGGDALLCVRSEGDYSWSGNRAPTRTGVLTYDGSEVSIVWDSEEK